MNKTLARHRARAGQRGSVSVIVALSLMSAI
jgi:hypothetical protein